MDWKKIKDKKAKLSEAAKRIENQKKLLRNVERKLRVKRYIQIGELVEKAGYDIGHDETDPALFAILSEHLPKLANKDERARLVATGNEALTASAEKYIVSFRSAPSPAAIAQLEKLKFKWHEVVNQWHGFAKKEEMNQLKNSAEAQIKAVK